MFDDGDIEVREKDIEAPKKGKLGWPMVGILTLYVGAVALALAATFINNICKG